MNRLSAVKCMDAFRLAACACAVAVTAFGFTAVSMAAPATAQADQQLMAVVKGVDKNGKTLGENDCYSIESAMDTASSYDDASNVSKVVINLKCDWDTSEYKVINVPTGANYTFELEGHMINRGLAGSKSGNGWWGTSNGSVISVGDYATLTVKGGNSSVAHPGTLSDNNRFWKSDLSGKDCIYGGLITGGATNERNCGGGISTTSNKVEIYLNGVTVAGNISTTDLKRFGRGAGIYVHAAESILDLRDAEVMYNHAEDDGGGIYVDGGDATVHIMDGSKVDNNYSDENGGGVCYDAKGGMVYMRGASSISGNIAKGAGGGICDFYNGTEITVNGSDICNNIAAGTNFTQGDAFSDAGGGILMNDYGKLNLINGSHVDGNSAKVGAGIALDDDDIAVTLSDKSTISNNIASKNGGGVYIRDDDISLTLSGSSKISGNKAVKGAGVYLTTADAVSFFAPVCSTITLNSGSSICDNAASEDGGGIYDNLGGHLFVQGLTLHSQDGTGAITRNTAARYGGGVHAETHFKVSNLSITENGAGQYGGGIYANTYMYVGGTLVVQKNYVKGLPDNLSQGTSDINILKNLSSSNLTKSSRIGVNVHNYYKKHYIIDGDEYLAGLVSNSDVFSCDDPSYSLTRSNKDAYYLKAGSKFNVSIYGEDAQKANVESYAKGDTVNLYSGVYRKHGYLLDSWSVEGIESTKTITPNADGIASFTMPGNAVTVRAHYTQILKGIELLVNDSASWNELGSKADSTQVSALKLETIASDTYGAYTTEEMRKEIKVTGVSVKEADGKKNVTYIVTMSNKVLEGYGLTYQESEFKYTGCVVDTGFDQALTEDGTLKAATDGFIELTFTVELKAPADAVTIEAVNVNKISDADAQPFDTVVQQVSELTGVSGGAAVVATAGDEDAQENNAMTITAPEEPGWSFTSWGVLSDGGVEDPQTHALTVEAGVAVSSLKLTANYTPLVSAVAIKLDVPKAGEEFPSVIESCAMAGANERDLTSYVKDLINVKWTLEDGTPAGDTAQGGVTYKVKISANGDQYPYVFGTADSVYTTVNGEEPYSCEYDAGSQTGSITYYVKVADDDSCDGLLYEYPVASVYEASDIDDDLPTTAYYKLKSGEVANAPVTWDTSAVDTTQTSGYFSVKGSFEDKQGSSHEVTQVFSIINLEAPEAKYAEKSDGVGTQTVTLGKGEGWQGEVDYKISYAVVSADVFEGADSIDESAFKDYNDSVELGAGKVLVAYADVQLTNSVKQTEMGVYGRSLEFAKVKAGNAAYDADEAATSVTVTLGGKKLREGEDFQVVYGFDYGVGKVHAAIVSSSCTFSGYKEFTCNIVPAKVTGLKVKASGKKKAKFSWSKHATQTDGFQVRYAASKAKLAKNKGTLAKVKGAASKSYTAKKLKSGKKYYFKVRAYKVVDGKTYWSAWSTVKSIKAK